MSVHHLVEAQKVTLAAPHREVEQLMSQTLAVVLDATDYTVTLA